jgi:hypothetical protein
MTHPTDDELEAMAVRLDVDDPWCQPMCYEAAAMLRACKAGDAPDYLDGWNDAREAAAHYVSRALDALTSGSFDQSDPRIEALSEYVGTIRDLTPPERPKP